MIQAHLKKLRARDTISQEEEAAIRDLISEVRDFPEDVTVVRHGVDLSESLMLLDGWMARTKTFADGQQQIAELQFCGDFVDLHSFTLKKLDHNVVSLTPVKLGVVPHTKITQLIERFPHLGRVYWTMTNIDAAIHREWTASLGRRTALTRMAHLFCEIFIRLELVGQTKGNGYPFPLTQHELAECLGLTSVHVNRTLQDLRKRNVIEVGRGQVTITDMDGLKALGEFDDEYLYLEKRPR